MPLSRFNRDYEVVVRVRDMQTVTIKPPMRLSFDSAKSVAGGLNKLTARIYNLQQSNRLALVKDAEQIKRIPLTFRVGYEGTMQLVFKGTVHRGLNFREGPDQVTELECLDGGFDFLNSFTARTVKGKQRAIDAILGDMPNTGKGKMSDQPVLVRPRVLMGASAKLIDDIVDSGESWYIDDEKLYIIKTDEVVSNFIPVVNAASGLLNTPTREMSKVTFESLMNPTLKIGIRCRLASTSAPHLDGTYKIIEMGQSGDTHGAKWQQSVTGLLISGASVL